MHTSQGYMTAADLADYEALTDTGRHPECPGHDESAAWGHYAGIVYCSRAEVCPDADDLEPL